MSNSDSPAERVFRHTAERRWSQAIRWLNRPEDGELLRRAGDVFADALLGELRVRPEEVSDDDLERTLLLVQSGRLRLAAEHLEVFVEQLILRHRDHPERALAFAKFSPDSAMARSVLAQYGTPASNGGTRVVQSTRPGTASSGAIRSVFRSAAESEFYRVAAVELAPLVLFPNVALSAVVEYSQVQGLLKAAERKVFFRQVLDFVLTDPACGFVPLLCIELDGPSHQDAHRAGRDQAKDRIISIAGAKLMRIKLDQAYSPSNAVSLVRGAVGGRAAS